MSETRASVALYLATVALSTRSYYASKRIARAFNVRRLRVSFAPNQQRTLHVRFWLMDVPALADNAAPMGINVLGELGTVDYLAGDGDVKELRVDREFPSGYLVVDAENTDTAPHTLDVQAELEEMVY